MSASLDNQDKFLLHTAVDNAYQRCHENSMYWDDVCADVAENGAFFILALSRKSSAEYVYNVMGLW